MGVPHRCNTDSAGLAVLPQLSQLRCQQANSFMGVSHLPWGWLAKVVLYRGKRVAHLQLPGAKNKTHDNDFNLSEEIMPP